MRKYQGRGEMTQRQIPFLNCLWNDVLFFTPVHPEAIRDGFIAAGSRWTPQKWIGIDPTVYLFDGQNTVIYNPDIHRSRGDFALLPNQFSPFNADRVSAIYKLPETTLDYYRKAVERGEPIFAWWGLPHILHRGSIAINDTQILEV